MSKQSIITHIPGYPRIGERRELKWAVEKFWRGESTESELLEVGATLRSRHWNEQKDAGLSFVTVNDFSLYDHVLDTACTFGIIPSRFGWTGDTVSTDLYFTLARGNKEHAPLAMTKWLNTNYHYLVPEVDDAVPFKLASTKIVDEFKEAVAAGHRAKPVLLGPVSLLEFSRQATPDAQAPLTRLDELLPLYVEVLNALTAAGADWVQVDEPILATRLTSDQRKALAKSYTAFASDAPDANLLLASYFGRVNDNLNAIYTLPVAGVHIDAVSSADDARIAARYLPDHMALSLGVIDGRNIWTADLKKKGAFVHEIAQLVPAERLWLSSSCSLLHVPHTTSREDELDAEKLSWLAFAREKLAEVQWLAGAIAGTPNLTTLTINQNAIANRRDAAGVHAPSVRQRLTDLNTPANRQRAPFAVRVDQQQKALNLPTLPTTTIGSFPQTADVRRTRSEWLAGTISHAEYQSALEDKTRDCIRKQEEIGLDVLAHGEFERNDMVEYFAEGLDGLAVTRFGWVQSYGSRCVKPPVIWGDVSRSHPLTVGWTQFAQSLTDRPVKGMLTGPVTILQWSFVRDDLPRSEVTGQLALAIRDEINDLEQSGTKIIQVDEPALREGLPLRKEEHASYLKWAADAFKLATSGVADSTQIHTHMCYCQFGDIFETIIDLDADVISIETTRNRLKVLEAFREHGYPNSIGPGIWDIHSPRVPSTDEMVELLEKAQSLIPTDRLWVNPDCGLKTRQWPETEASLRNLVAAARTLREHCEAPACV